MTELLKAQKQWNRKLARPFANEAVETALEPQRNAVSISLGSSVSRSERAVIARKASTANVNVLVTDAAGPHLGITPEAKECDNFVKEIGNCEPSITAGVGIANKVKCKKVAKREPGFATQAGCEERAAKATAGEWVREGLCTAGPAAIPVANKKARVLLTAGHCIAKFGGLGAEWLALKRNLEAPRLGAAEEFFNGAKEGEGIGDFGEIAIEAEGAWETGIPADPVLAVTAEWSRNEETRYRVKGERTPVVGNTNCHEGNTSGETCGKIKTLNVAMRKEGKIVEGLVEDEGSTSEEGDSGGPWLFVATEGNPNHEALIEGTHVGKDNECVKRAEAKKGEEFFLTEAICRGAVKGKKEGGEGAWEWKENKENQVYEPLKQPVKGGPKGSLEALNLELLTTANEEIKEEKGKSC